MNSIVLLISIVIALGLVFLCAQLLQRLYNSLSQKVYCVLAGDGDQHPMHYDRNERLRPFESFRFNGRRIDPSKYILARVEGECMHPRGIHSGNLVFIQKLSEKEKSDMKDNSILYIRCMNNGVENYFLREYVKEKSGGGIIATRFYRNGVEPKDSNPHHSLDNVIGIVRYCFE